MAIFMNDQTKEFQNLKKKITDLEALNRQMREKSDSQKSINMCMGLNHAMPLMPHTSKVY